MSYVPGRWVDHPIEADGRRLIFYVEPAYDAGFDVVVCENLADALEEVEKQVGCLEKNTTFIIKAKWRTPAELAREKAAWGIE